MEVYENKGPNMDPRNRIMVRTPIRYPRISECSIFLNSGGGRGGPRESYWALRVVRQHGLRRIDLFLEHRESDAGMLLVNRKAKGPLSAP